MSKNDKTVKLSLSPVNDYSQYVAIQIKPPLRPKPPVPELRGFMYMVVDSKYPEFIKIGMTTDLPLRLKQYNADRPVPFDVKPVYISPLYRSIKKVEKTILSHIYEQGCMTPGKKLEWFDAKHTDLITDVLNQAEKIFDTDRNIPSDY